jgi:dipeptidase E
MDLNNIKLVVIGGGEIKNNETLAIDKCVVELAGESHPRVLFIPTATSDSRIYVDRFKDVYEGQLSCRVNVLSLMDPTVKIKEIERSIFETDVIYVGGGDTVMMMNVWKNRGVDKLLLEAMERNSVVFAGLSAGAICWFEEGLTDIEEAGKAFDYQKIKGLGIINGLFCPHFNIWERDLTSRLPAIGVKSFIAADNGAALVLNNGKVKVISTKAESSVYRVTVEENSLVKLNLGKKVPGDFLG